MHRPSRSVLSSGAGVRRVFRPLKLTFALLCALAMLAARWSAAPAEAETRIEFVPTFSTNARIRQQLERMDRLAKQKQWDDWLNAYQQLVDDPRDLVVARDEEFLVGVRHYCHQLLSALPAEARTRYRTRFDIEARKVFDAAQRENSRSGMRDVYSRFRFSSYGSRALQWLADRALDEGRMEYARTAYSRLAKEPGAPVNTLLRYAMAASGAGRPAEAKEALDRARKQYGAIPVQLAGQQANGHAAAAAVAEMMKRPDVPAAPAWTSFAGDGTRMMSGAPGGPVRKLWSFVQPSPPQSSYYPGFRGGGQLVVIGATGSGSSRMRFSFLGFPVLRGEDVWVQGPRSVTRLSLETGKATWDQQEFYQRREEAPRENTNPRQGGIFMPNNRPVQAAPSVDGHFLVTRVGLIGGSRESSRWPADQAIAVLDTRTGRQLWRKIAGGDPNGIYYNLPTLHQNIIFTGVATFRGGITEYNAVALDLGSGEPLWSTYLGAGSDALGAVDGSPALVRDGLVWVESSLYTLSALDLVSGEIRLIYHYQPGKRSSWRGGIDTTPAIPNEPVSLIAGGTGPIVFAPRWGTDVIAIDPNTLKMIWASPKARDLSTAGVLFAIDKERAYVCGSQVRAISLTDGKQEWTWEPPQSAGSVGFAALCGDKVYVPVDNKIYVLGAADRKELEPVDLGDAIEDGSGPATLLIVNNRLIVSTKDRVAAFGPK